MSNQVGRPRPALFRALGNNDPPGEIRVDDEYYSRIEIYKHDSWAATALYKGQSRKIVCKFNRIQPIFGIPTSLLGKRLANRERQALEKLSDMQEIPKPLGPVFVEGRLLSNAVARVYVPGHPLGKREKVNSHFFRALREAILTMHQRGIAYVDLHNRENIIVGDDGCPSLVDFQICFDVTKPRIRWIPGIQIVFKWFCEMDLYHLAKHICQSSTSEFMISRPDIPTFIKIHRLVAVPFRELRRRLLVISGIRRGKGSVVTEAFVEDALRQDSSAQAA